MSPSQPTVLVVGGTGPSGVCIVEEFLAAGYAVTIYHTGRHEVDFTAPTEHIHGDPRDETDIRDKLGSRHWDLAVCTSGRLRSLALCLDGRVRRLVGITGQPVYLGTMQPTPAGTLALPIPEHAPRQFDASGYTGKVAIGEDQLFEQHRQGAFEAVVVRYPGVYGPRGSLSHEWAVVRRILDGRTRMILPHDGMAYFQRGYVENLGRLVFLAATVAQASGEAFNAGDETVLSARHVAELIVDELGAPMELIGVPAQWCRGAYPLAEKSSLILDMGKARRLLGYTDRVDAQTATRLTARWLAGPQARAMEFSDAFGGRMPYADEDRILDAWQVARQAFESRARH